MITKDQVIDKLDRFKAYSLEQEPEFETYFDAFFVPLYGAVETYFSTKHPEMEDKLKELVHNMYCDVSERNTQNEFQFGEPLPTDYPETYNDIRKCFYQFPLTNVTNEDFFAEWVIGVPPLPEGSDPATAVPEPEQPLGHPSLELWVTEVTNAKQDEVDKVAELLNWVKNSASTNGMSDLLEDSGKVIKSISTEDVAKIIYKDKGLLEVIRTFDLNVYIPSYLR